MRPDASQTSDAGSNEIWTQVASWTAWRLIIDTGVNGAHMLWVLWQQKSTTSHHKQYRHRRHSSCSWCASCSSLSDILSLFKGIYVYVCSFIHIIISELAAHTVWNVPRSASNATCPRYFPIISGHSALQSTCSADDDTAEEFSESFSQIAVRWKKSSVFIHNKQSVSGRANNPGCQIPTL